MYTSTLAKQTNKQRNQNKSPRKQNKTKNKIINKSIEKTPQPNRFLRAFSSLSYQHTYVNLVNYIHTMKSIV